MPTTTPTTDPHDVDCACVACLLCDAHNVHADEVGDDPREWAACQCGHPECGAC